MYAEELRHKKIGTVAGIFMTVGIVFFILFCIFVVSFLQFWLRIFWLQFVLYGAAIFAVFLIVKYFITEYIYLIEKDRITFGRRIGRREKELIFIPFREIVSFGKYADMQEAIKEKKVFKYTFKKKEDWYVINCTGCAVIVTVTDQYITALEAVKKK